MAETEAPSADRVIVASSDTHVGPRPEDLRPYCEQRLLAEFDAFTAATAQTPGFVSRSGSSGDEFDWNQIVTPAHWDVYERLHQMDADGVAAEVIFHGSQNGQPIPFMNSAGSFTSAPAVSEQDLAVAGMRIYNRWLADFCSVEPERHAGLAHIPFWDMDLAVQEMKWAATAGLRGINFPAPRPSLPDYNDPWWDPFFAAAADSGMPLETHGASETLTDGLARYRGQGGLRLRRLEVAQFSRRGLPWMILGGAFDRHPNLKYVMTELNGVSAVLPLMLLELDELRVAFSRDDDDYKPLGKTAIEYFESNCYIGASFMSRADAQGAVDQGLVNNYMWGSDFPHREGSYPCSTLSIRMAVEGMQPTAIRRLVGLNTVDLFGLDRLTLQAVADRVGPTLDGLTTAVESHETPEPEWMSTYSMAFRKGVMWA